MLSIISSFLQERTMKVVHDGQTSASYVINAGVPQGSVLGPTLFLLFINDLPDGALSRIGIYADDTPPHIPALKHLTILTGLSQRLNFSSICVALLSGV